MAELFGWLACLGLGLIVLGLTVYLLGVVGRLDRRTEEILRETRESRQHDEFWDIADRLKASDPEWLKKYEE